MVERMFKVFLVVIGKYILPGAEQPLNLGVVLGDKFNDQKPAYLTQKSGDMAEGHIVGDCQMVNQRQREDRIGRPPFDQRKTFFVCPPDRWAGIGQVQA